MEQPTVKSLSARLRPSLGALVAGIACLIVVAAIDLSLPLFFGKGVVDQVLLQAASPVLLSKYALGGILLFLVKGIFTYGQVYLMSYVGQRLVLNLRADTYRHLLRAPLSFHAQHRSGELISRVTADVGVIQNAISAGIGDLVQHSLSLVGILILIIYLNASLAVIALVSLPLAALAINGYGGRIRVYSGRLQERIADLTSILQESLEGIRILKAFRMEPMQKERFEHENERSFRASMKSVQAMATVTPVVELILVAGMMLVIWSGSRAVLAGRLTTGELISFMAYLGMATRPVGFLTRSFNLMQQAFAAWNRILSILDAPVEPAGDPQKAGCRRLGVIRGAVQFEHVYFSYPTGDPVLHDINFEAQPGEVIALVGPSGAGKSTLVNLIPRFYEATSGAVRVDGYDVREITLDSLRRQIGIVPQETVLFGMSVSANIAVGKDVAFEHIRRAAEVANAHEFIMQLPQGYDTRLGERGATLSGGQRQRLAIARAVVGDPRILILDEATSALDTESEALVQEALARARENRTTFVVAHRLSTVRSADKILVLDKGRITESGTHASLIAGEGLYHRLYARTNGEEIEP